VPDDLHCIKIDFNEITQCEEGLILNVGISKTGISKTSEINLENGVRN